jgi:hypothetical protein
LNLGDEQQTNWQFYSASSRIAAAIALLLGASYLAQVPKTIEKIRFPSLILIAMLIRLFSILSVPNPPIDLFYILRDGPRLLLEGENPYKMQNPAPYGVFMPHIVFAYGPFAALLYLPSSAFANDPRYVLFAADLLSVFLIFKLAKFLKIENIYATLISVIFLYHPLIQFIAHQAWVDPAVTTLLLASVYFMQLSPKSFLPGVFLGLVVAIKSVYALPFLVYLKNKKSKLPVFLAMAATPALISLPFFLADPRLFIKRTIEDPGIVNTLYLGLTNASLSVSAVVFRYTNVVIPTGITAAIGLLFAFFMIIKSRHITSLALISMFLTFMVMFTFAPYVFVNYFYLFGNILLIASLFAISEKENS